MKPFVIFTYDKTFEGFLSCVFFAYEQKITPDTIQGEDEPKPLFFDYSYHIITEEEKSKRVWKSLESKLSPFARKMVFNVWLSEVDEVETLLFRYVTKIIDSSISIEMNFGDDDILTVSKIAKKVGSEARKVIQFVRFQQTKDGIYFAPVAPRYNIISMTVNHFKKRYADQEWIIYDTNRRFGLYYDLSEVNEVTFDRKILDAFTEGALKSDKASESEIFFKELWKTYFQHLTIKERFNPQLQLQHMPRRYWKYLTEMQ